MSTPGPSAAFLLAQLGAVAADRFAHALAELELTPPQAGVLRTLGADPGMSQQTLATRLGTAPSRVVSHLDHLEARGALSRTPGSDRRVNVLTLTPEGRDLLAAVGRVAREHDRTLLATLDTTDLDHLRRVLTSLATNLGVTPHAHPGYNSNPT